MVERADPTLSVSQQCRLLAVSRSSVYRRPPEVSEQDRTIMALIDRQYLARPYYGSRRMAAWLATQGHLVNRKRATGELIFSDDREATKAHGRTRSCLLEGVVSKLRDDPTRTEKNHGATVFVKRRA